MISVGFLLLLHFLSSLPIALLYPTHEINIGCGLGLYISHSTNPVRTGFTLSCVCDLPTPSSSFSSQIPTFSHFFRSFLSSVTDLIIISVTLTLDKSHQRPR